MKIFIIIAFILGATTAIAKDNLGVSKDPIKIESNELTIEQKEHKGIFVGNVEVIQGDMTINSDKMIVYYIESSPSEISKEQKPARDIPSKEDNPDGKPLNDSSDQLPSHNKISRIETFGNVVITTPNEKAKGDKGEYIVKDEVFVLFGNVTLTQGNNILTGTKFVYNKLTGKGTLTSNSKNSKKKGRAKALIIPGQVQ